MKKIFAMLLMLGALSGMAYFCTGESALANTTVAEETVSEVSYKTVEMTIHIEAVNGEDIAAKLDGALKEARDSATDAVPVTVKVPAGNYQLGHSLHIFSNTILDLSAGVTLQYTASSGNMLMSGTSGSYKGYDNYNMSAACNGYNGFKNITVQGGTWIGNDENESSLIRIAHATNVKLENMILSHGGCAHQAELAAINGLLVKKCTFKDYGKTEGSLSDDKQEALQLDIPCSSKIYKNVYEDGTTMKNVEISGCLFENVPRGVGSHSLLNGAYHENIKINNNTFVNVLEQAVIALNYYNCEINNNKMNNCGAGILVQYFKSNPISIYTTIFDGKQTYKGSIRHDAKTVISGNSITTKYSETCEEIQGIKIYGRNMTANATGRDKKVIPAGNYYISGINVSDNTIVTAGHGIHLMGARNCQVYDNNITGKNYSNIDKRKGKYDGIFVENGCRNINVSSNMIKNPARGGIFAQGDSNLAMITKNTIIGCGDRGIHLYNTSGVRGEISDNSIRNCKKSGIMLNRQCSAGAICNNRVESVSGSAARGIVLYDCCQVKGDISANKITKCSDNAIHISTKCTVKGGIRSNKIKAAGKNGIFVYSESGVSRIQNNVIESAKGYGIYMTTGAKGSIYANTYKKGAKSMLYVMGTTKGLVPKSVSVKKVSTPSKKKIKMTWKKVSGVSGYEVQYSTKPDFLSGVKTTKIKKGFTSVNLSKVTSGKNYYVRIASYKTKQGVNVFSDYSKVKKITVK